MPSWTMAWYFSAITVSLGYALIRAPGNRAAMESRRRQGRGNGITESDVDLEIDASPGQARPGTEP